MVEGGRARWRQRLERLDLGHERREQQRLEQARVVAQPERRLRVGRPLLQLLPADSVVALEQRQELLRPELLRVLELQARAFRERLVALGDHVPEVAHRDDHAELELVAPLDQELQHELQRRPLALQER